MRKDKDWVAGARLRFGNRTIFEPTTQESYIFTICRDLRDANVQVLDLKTGFTMATFFEVKAPSRRSAHETARQTIQKTTAAYLGNLTLVKLNVVPKDEVYSIMLEARPNTWPEISRGLPEERLVNSRASVAEQLPDNETEENLDDGPLAEIIPLFPNLQASRLSHPSNLPPRQLAEVVSLFSTIRRDRP